MNEATLEARVNAEIQKHFPAISGLRITHQKILSLRVGHHTDIAIDGTKRKGISGRLDVLISSDDRPLVVLELKAPGEALSDDDREQGLSYARLLTPQPPLLIVSNGDDAQFYQTYDGSIWTPANKDEEAVRALFAHSLSCAANERDEAVRLLLGKQPGIWRGLLQKYTDNALNELEGAIDDYTRPLARDFRLTRAVVGDIAKLVSAKQPLIVLTGPPLSGKTNIITQLCRSRELNELMPVYIDGTSTSYGLFQHLANQFSRELYIQVSASDVRQWLLHGVHQTGEGHLVIIVDGWIPDNRNTLQQDVEEIISFLGPDRSLSLILGMDETAFKETSTASGRPTHTAIGRNAKVLGLSVLDDDEFELACKTFYDKYRVCFHDGAQHNMDFRVPRLLRLLAAALNRQGRIFAETGDQVGCIPSVTSFLIFESWRQFVTDPRLQADLDGLARAYIRDETNRSSDPGLILMSHGRGHILYQTAEEMLGRDRLNSLMSQGHIGLVRGPRGKVLVLPKVPEFLASAAAYHIGEQCYSISRTSDIEDSYRYLVRESDSFPYGDLVGAKALVEIAKRDRVIAHELIYRLLHDEPEEGRFREGSRGLMYFDDLGEIDVYFGEGSDEPTRANVHPWLILSQLATFGTVATQDSIDPHLRILATIGSYPDLLLRPAPCPFKDVRSYQVHEIPGHGTVLCHKSGIIEPITYAMQRGFYHMPESMVRLCEFAEKGQLFFLAHRLHFAALSTETCIESEVAAASAMAMEILRPLVRKEFEMHDPDPVPQRAFGKVGRNKPCPCGSGKKYKKCCGR